MARKDQDPKQQPGKSLVQWLLDQVRRQFAKPPERSYFEPLDPNRPDIDRAAERRQAQKFASMNPAVPVGLPKPPRPAGITRDTFNNDPTARALKDQQSLDRLRHEKSRQAFLASRETAENMRQQASERFKHDKEHAQLMLEGLPRYLPIPGEIGGDYNKQNNSPHERYAQDMLDIQDYLENIEVEIRQNDWKLSNEALLLLTHQPEPEAPDLPEVIHLHQAPEAEAPDTPKAGGDDWVAQFNHFAAAQPPEAPSPGGISR